MDLVGAEIAPGSASAILPESSASAQSPPRRAGVIVSTKDEPKIEGKSAQKRREMRQNQRGNEGKREMKREKGKSAQIAREYGARKHGARPR